MNGRNFYSIAQIVIEQRIVSGQRFLGQTYERLPNLTSPSAFPKRELLGLCFICFVKWGATKNLFLRMVKYVVFKVD